MNGMAKSKKDLKRPQTQYVEIVKDLSLSWSAHKLPTSLESFGAKDTPPDGASDFSVPIKVVHQIQVLLLEHEKGRKRSEDAPYLF